MMIEFAFVLPIMLVLFFGAVEVTRFILILQKVDKVAYTMADIVTRSTPDPTPGVTPPSGAISPLTTTELADILGNYDDLMVPYAVEGRGLIIVTSIQRPTGSAVPLVKWQMTDGGVLSGPGIISEINQLPPSGINPSVRNTPVNFSTDIQNSMNVSAGLRNNENIVAVEVFYRFDPLFFNNSVGIGSMIVKRNAFFNPRYGTLTRLPPDFTS